ncbi:MAG: hypothetical protein ABW360_04655 [Phenylobacterium sp.]
MSGFISSWRKAGGLFAALVLAAMAFGAPVAAMTCVDERGPAVSSADQSVLPTAAADQDDSQCADGCGRCASCSCHHAGAFTPAATPTVYRPIAHPARHAELTAARPASDLVFGFKRPPRD